MIRQEKQNEATKKPKAIEAVSAELLSFRSIKEGMVIMGCVRAINPTSLEIALPGRMNGIVEVSAISETYLKLAEQFIENDSNDDKSENENEYQPLSDIFKLGQIVTVRVLQIDTSKTNKIIIKLSMSPKEVHAEYQHHGIRTKMIMSVAIAERQEHGYVIETGVKNLRGFLPQPENKAKDNLIVGSVHYCCVESVMVAPTASTATFSLYARKYTQLEEPNVTYIMPGSIVGFNVKKLLKDGIQGTIYDEPLVAYVNEHQLGCKNKVAKEPKDFKVGDFLPARVLYVMPLTKIVYLSLIIPDSYQVAPMSPVVQVKANQSYYDIHVPGTIIENAVVSHIGTGGIILKLPGSKGIISLRSLKGEKVNFDMDIVMAKYQKGSVHKVRVLHYDPIDYLHICSVDKQMLDEKYFGLDDVKTGDILNAKITRKSTDGRYAVQVGRIKGYFSPLFLSKTTPAKKLEGNQSIKCRVICKNTTKNEIFVTNLKEFLEPNASILTADSELTIDSIFVGVIKKKLSDGWLIGFFDYLNGMIYRNQCTATQLSTADRFYEGQVLRVTIKNVRNDGGKKQIALGLADFLTDIGAVHSGKVTAIQQTGIDVAFLTGNLNGFIPTMYLSNFTSLVHALQRSYQCYDNVKAIGAAQNCYSIRDLKDQNGDDVTVKRICDINVGDIIPAFIKNVANELIEVNCLLRDFRATVPIHYRMFVEDSSKLTGLSLVPDQKIYVRVKSVNKNLRTLTLSAKLHDVWSFNFKETCLLYRQYFEDLNKIKGALNKEKSVRAYNVGQTVDGTLSTGAEVNGQQVKTFILDDGVQVYVTKNNEFELDHNEKAKLLIIWIDYTRNVLYGTMIKKYFDRMLNKQDENKAADSLIAHRGFKANVLLILEDLMVVYPAKHTNRFVYIPTRFHLNDFQPIVSKGISEGEQINVSMIDVGGDHFLGMIHKWHELYNSKVEQIVLTTKEEKVKNANDEPSEPPKKKQKKAKAVNEPLDVSAKEINEESEKKDPKVELDQSVNQKAENGKKKSKKRKAGQTITTIDVESDDAETTTSPKKKRNNQKSEAVLEPEAESFIIEEPATVTPAKKSKKSKKSATAKNSAKKSPKFPSKKKNPKKSPGKFSMKSMQVDGALDLQESDSDEEENSKAPALPGVSNFWSTDLNTLNTSTNANCSDSSSEDEDDTATKKRKLSSKDRFDAARKEEDRIREIERSLADETIQPTSIDQFDRLVMAEPNNSRAWIKYMVFHVQATEIDRARAIAQKALKTIDVREQQERLNIWVALLNMELRYGSKDAFEEALKEALLVNEPFKVYSVCLRIFADCKRVQELNDTVMIMTKKFRQNPECWTNTAQALFDVDLADKAKALLARALSSLPERDRKCVKNDLIRETRKKEKNGSQSNYNNRIFFCSYFQISI